MSEDSIGQREDSASKMNRRSADRFHVSPRRRSQSRAWGTDKSVTIRWYRFPTSPVCRRSINRARE